MAKLRVAFKKNKEVLDNWSGELSEQCLKALSLIPRSARAPNTVKGSNPKGGGSAHLRLAEINI